MTIVTKLAEVQPELAAATANGQVRAQLVLGVPNTPAGSRRFRLRFASARQASGETRQKANEIAKIKVN